MLNKFKIIQIFENDTKSNITKEILKELPDYFLDELAVLNYVNKVKTLLFWASYNEENKKRELISLVFKINNFV
ncbi:MAG: hypothetical protein J6Q58_00560 [Clostridia bacterium]|nr:hypothetical protein [Clostridia bacterium]